MALSDPVGTIDAGPFDLLVGSGTKGIWMDSDVGVGVGAEVITTLLESIKEGAPEAVEFPENIPLELGNTIVAESVVETAPELVSEAGIVLEADVDTAVGYDVGFVRIPVGDAVMSVPDGMIEEPGGGRTPEVVPGNAVERSVEICDSILDRMLLKGSEVAGAVPVGTTPDTSEEITEATLETKLDTILDTGSPVGCSEATDETMLPISDVMTESTLESCEDKGGIGMIPAEVGAVGPGAGSVTPDPLLGTTPEGSPSDSDG